MNSGRTGGAIDVEVQGNGNDPPPFHAALTGPGPITLSQPLDSSTVDRRLDLEFAWTGEANGYVLVMTRNENQDRYISCRWSAGDETRVIPSLVLSGLPAGNVSFVVRVESPPSAALLEDWVLSATATLDAVTLAAVLQ